MSSEDFQTRMTLPSPSSTVSGLVKVAAIRILAALVERPVRSDFARNRAGVKFILSRNGEGGVRLCYSRVEKCDADRLD
jgi:hypothetical protein